MASRKKRVGTKDGLASGRGNAESPSGRGNSESPSGRGSPEAVEKRRAARALNALLTDGKSKSGLDGRTEKRRLRLIKELIEGKNGSALSPIDVVSHVDELMKLGETIASLKKQGVKPRKTEVSDEVMEVVQQTQSAYDFAPEAWRMLGIRWNPKKRGKR